MTFLKRALISRNLRVLIAVLSVGTMLFGLWWFCFRTVFWIPGARVSYASGGTPSMVTFVVHDETGQPVAGMPVDCETSSGWTDNGLTDIAGRAVMDPAEGVIIAVRIGSEIVRFRSGGMFIEDFFAPNSMDGLTVTVVLKN